MHNAKNANSSHKCSVVYLVFYHYKMFKPAFRFEKRELCNEWCRHVFLKQDSLQVLLNERGRYWAEAFSLKSAANSHVFASSYLSFF